MTNHYSHNIEVTKAYLNTLKSGDGVSPHLMLIALDYREPINKRIVGSIIMKYLDTMVTFATQDTYVDIGSALFKAKFVKL